MRKIFVFFLFSLAIVTASQAQNPNDTLVLVKGTLLNVSDSTPVTGIVYYEKLPYYDDMGVVSAGSNGSFEVQLIKNQKYNFKVTKQGFKPFAEEKEVTGALTYNIYIKEDALELLKLEQLNFASGSDRISPSSYKELDELADFLLQNPSLVIQLEGHTDFAGNADANMRLSEARVIAVQEYLIDKKVKKNRIFTKAFGGTNPVTQDRSDEGRAINRRVEVRFIRR